ncbi:hypothetical protein GCM10009733_059950 [Nonomuraea maheshkhaliensis]|uniref:Uncharacterized protein n=1 Tax=Nonomuraea maheshkhaliensis TaxID=419590 RepID=A0ABN2FPA3_9ACTN
MVNGSCPLHPVSTSSSTAPPPLRPAVTRVHPRCPLGRTTATGQARWCSTAWLTEPNTAEAKPPVLLNHATFRTSFDQAGSERIPDT